jgi:hypothetical protein
MTMNALADPVTLGPWLDSQGAYCARRGFTAVPDLRYYRVLYNFRLAVLLEGIFQRAMRDPGRGPQPDIGEMVLHHMHRAATLTGTREDGP